MSFADSALAAGAGGLLEVGGGLVEVGGGGCSATSPLPRRRTASVMAASAAAVAVSSPVPDADRISPALRSSAAKSRSEERRVGKECRSRRAAAQEKRKTTRADSGQCDV